MKTATHSFCTIVHTFRFLLIPGISYETFYSISQFPGTNLEVDAAYKRIVLEKVVPFYKNRKRTNPLADDMVQYFSNISNRDDIMKNFVRFTVYIKDLTVQTSEQVPAYTELDLLSDIGKSKSCCFIMAP